MHLKDAKGGIPEEWPEDLRVREMPEKEQVSDDARTVAWVRWFDASYQRGECTLGELVSRVELESAGLLIQEDEESVSIALDSYVGDSTFRYIEHIPKVNVLELRRLLGNAEPIESARDWFRYGATMALVMEGFSISEATLKADAVVDKLMTLWKPEGR